MRKLILIRIVHSLKDMGSMGGVLEEESIAKVGEQRWMENQKKIEKFWNDVEAEINTLKLNYSRVRIYQDGLPRAGDFVLKIVKEAASKGSRNYQIVEKLIEKGATVEETENPKLLLKEYSYLQMLLKATTQKEKSEIKHQYQQVKDEILDERDTFIAKTINETLKDDETGILFIGAEHNVASKLAEDIEVTRLD